MTSSISRQNVFFLSSVHPIFGAYTFITLNILTSTTNLTATILSRVLITYTNFVLITLSYITRNPFLYSISTRFFSVENFILIPNFFCIVSNSFSPLQKRNIHFHFSQCFHQLPSSKCLRVHIPHSNS